MSDERINVAFFGCWGSAGHVYRKKNGSSISDYEADKNGLPHDHDLDGSRLLLPYPEVKDHGCCTYLPNTNLTILSWWNSVWDERGKVNSHFLCRGYIISAHSMWDAFQHCFPDVAKHHTKPIVRIL